MFIYMYLLKVIQLSMRFDSVFLTTTTLGGSRGLLLLNIK